MLKDGKNTIYENDRFFAVTPNVISQKYQIMVFPKKHIESVFDINNKDVQELFEVTVKIAKHMEKVLKMVAFRFKLNEKLFILKSTPYHLKHIHFHIIPRFEGQDSEPDYDKRIWLTENEKKEIVDKLRIA